jgi:glycine cleavage system protein P-like pyridoxal-binding family
VRVPTKRAVTASGMVSIATWVVASSWKAHPCVRVARRSRALDIAKRLIDYSYHPPTIYFPLIVDEALMIEPTEAESRASLDAFCDAMLAIAREAEEEPQVLKDAPTTAPRSLLGPRTSSAACSRVSMPRDTDWSDPED